jgi:hypothetical protein
LIDALRFLNQNVTNEWQDLRIDELLKWPLPTGRSGLCQNPAFSNALR